MKITLLMCAAALMFGAMAVAPTPTVATTQQSSTTSAADSPQDQAPELVKQGRKVQSDGKLGEAISAFYKALAIMPGYWEAEAGIGSALDLIGDFTAAREHLQKAVDLADPAHKVGALRSLAMSYAFECKLPEVEKYERQAEQLQINDKKYTDAAGTLNEMARIRLDCGDIDHAYDTYKEGYGLAGKAVTKPEDKDLWDFRWEHAQARIDARRGLKDEADKHEAAAKAIFEKKTLPPAQGVFVPYLTGYVAFYGGDYKAALGDLLKADQRDPFILALIAQTYEKLNNKVEAKEYWTKVLRIYSHNPTNAYARPLAKKAMGE